jgi:excisionase family DNA binding protein
MQLQGTVHEFASIAGVWAGRRRTAVSTAETQSATLSVAEVSKILGLGINGTYRAIRKREIPGVVKIGRKHLVRKAIFEPWLNGESDPTGQTRPHSM